MEKLPDTIEECHKIIRLLQNVVSDLSKQVETLSKRVEMLAAENRDLKERLNGNSSNSSLPEGISWGITGPRLTSLMSELVTKYGLSRREQQQFLKEQLNFKISLGTVFNKQNQSVNG